MIDRKIVDRFFMTGKSGWVYNRQKISWVANHHSIVRHDNPFTHTGEWTNRTARLVCDYPWQFLSCLSELFYQLGEDRVRG